jgi:hypothetical protein
MTTGAFRTASVVGFGLPGLVPFKVSASLDLVSLSRIMISLQHCVLAQDGAQRAASRRVCNTSSLTGLSLYFLMLRLPLMASITSITVASW